MTQKFFVYGSYCRGFCQSKKISHLSKETQWATVLGSAYQDQFGYPIVFDDGTDHIQGELLEVDLNSVQMAFMDEMMGFNPLQPEESLNLRRESMVHITGGEAPLQAWVYFANPLRWNMTGAQKIQNGDWRTLLDKSPALPDGLNERQRSYILKLGASASRDVVRIDLNLYRELMNLELIVDKGRRLALTKKGQEVYRYLRS